MSQYVITNNVSNVGQPEGLLHNGFGAIKTLILTNKDYSFASVPSICTKATHIAAIRSKNIFPMPDSINIEDMSVDPVYASYDSGYQKKTRPRIKTIKISFDIPLF